MTTGKIIIWTIWTFFSKVNQLYVYILLFSRQAMSDSSQPHGLQHTRLPCSSHSPRVYSSSCPLRWWWYPTISSSASPFSFCLQSFLVWGSLPKNHLFASGNQNIGASASIRPLTIQGWTPCCPRDSQESSPAPLLESINSSALNLLYGPTLISIHDYRKNHSFDWTDLCLCLLICCLGI